MDAKHIMHMDNSAFLQLCNISLPALTKEFESIWRTAIQKYQELQNRTQKPDIKKIYISLLRSSVTTVQAWFQLDLRDSRNWGDFDECHENWCASSVVDSLLLIPESGMIGYRYLEQAEIEMEDRALELASLFLSFLQQNRNTIFQCIKKEGLCGVSAGIGEYMGRYVEI